MNVSLNNDKGNISTLYKPLLKSNIFSNFLNKSSIMKESSISNHEYLNKITNNHFEMNLQNERPKSRNFICNEAWRNRENEEKPIYQLPKSTNTINNLKNSYCHNKNLIKNSNSRISKYIQNILNSGEHMTRKIIYKNRIEPILVQELDNKKDVINPNNSDSIQKTSSIYFQINNTPSHNRYIPSSQQFKYDFKSGKRPIFQKSTILSKLQINHRSDPANRVNVISVKKQTQDSINKKFFSSELASIQHKVLNNLKDNFENGLNEISEKPIQKNYKNITVNKSMEKTNFYNAKLLNRKRNESELTNFRTEESNRLMPSLDFKLIDSNSNSIRNEEWMLKGNLDIHKQIECKNSNLNSQNKDVLKPNFLLLNNERITNHREKMNNEFNILYCNKDSNTNYTIENNFNPLSYLNYPK